MEPNTPELSTPPEQPGTPPKSHLPLLILILVIVLVGAFAYTKRENNTPVQNGTMTSTPESSTAKEFTPEVKQAIEKFVTTRMDILSPIPAATGTKFTVSSIEHKDGGETLIVYSDTKTDYTGRGVFETKGEKELNIVAFDIISSSTVQSGKMANREEQKLVEDYIKNNLSTLSPEKEVLGGKFFVTGLSFQSSRQATVEYEDGHNMYTAEVTYEVENGKDVKIVEWKIITK